VLDLRSADVAISRARCLVAVVGPWVFAACFGSSGEGPDHGSLDAGSADTRVPESSSPETGSSSDSDASDAAVAAFDLSALPSGAFAYTQGSYMVAFEFRALSPIHVTQLGYYDSNLTGTSETFAPADVGLYDMATNSLLGTVTVRSSDPAVGIFRFHALSSPIALGTSDTYAVAAVTGTDHYVSGFDYDGQLALWLGWVGFAGYGEDNLTQTTTLVQPNDFWTTTGNLGPNFLFDEK
jgi:hypothetical protein